MISWFVLPLPKLAVGADSVRYPIELFWHVLCCSQLVKAFKNEGAFPAVIGAVPLEGPLPETSVVYLFPEADLEEAKQVCSGSGVLTISGSPSLVEQGHVSIAIGENGGKAEIVVNLPRLKQEGHELSSQLLKLARVIQ
jgi:hypothetical protein